MQIQWFPGHMNKALRIMREDIKLVDVLIEIVDARMPLGSSNPLIVQIAAGKQRVVVLNKSDLADIAQTKKWIAYYKSQGIQAVSAASKGSDSMKPIVDAVLLAGAPILDRAHAKGLVNCKIKAMVTGIPNVGKSTLINSVIRKASAKTGNKPGVTKGRQWLNMHKSIELLDTPGVLWPKIEDGSLNIDAQNLALIGSLPDDLIDMTQIALYGCSFVVEHYPGMIGKAYGVGEDRSERDASLSPETTATEVEYLAILERIAAKRGCLKKNGICDHERAAVMFVGDFRSGKIGRVTLERRV